MIPDYDSPDGKALYLIIDPTQSVRNMTQFSTLSRDVGIEPPVNWLQTAHGMMHLLMVLVDGMPHIDCLDPTCLWDMLDVTQELERFAKPDTILDTILQGKGVIHNGRNGDT